MRFTTDSNPLFIHNGHVGGAHSVFTKIGNLWGDIMISFELYNPVKLIFGKDSQKKVGENIKPYADKVLLVYGGGSIKRNGLYDEVMVSLDRARDQSRGVSWHPA